MQQTLAPVEVKLPYGQLPRVHGKGKNFGSTRRALDHARDMLLKYEPDGERPHEIQVALDDLAIMLECVE